MEGITDWQIRDAFCAAGNLWAGAQMTGDDDTVKDAETLAATLRSIKERRDQAPRILELPLPGVDLVVATDSIIDAVLVD